MRKILCSTGALIGRPNNRDYRLLKDFAPKLNCDGFEFMVYDSWYPELDEMIETVKGYGLNIPVIHCEKALCENIAGGKAWYEGDDVIFEKLSEEEDKENYEKAIKNFKMNLRIANELGADRMVLHLWNGLVSDKNINSNVERFGILRDMAKEAGVMLMVENVICNTNDPLYNVGLVRNKYNDADFVYDTKMAEFHGQTMKVFEPEWQWMFAEGRVKHLHVNDYNGGVLDWSNFKVLPIGKGHVDFDGFFENLNKYEYNGDFTVEATGFNHDGVVNIEMLNDCFEKLRMHVK
ncbi:MAG: sugar phosphate isomerase/epimerase [Lachnospiraceae bacterium]|nr:sugar phosphate isomerase/epimerase [Lachnospiraceae bacterium]